MIDKCTKFEWSNQEAIVRNSRALSEAKRTDRYSLNNCGAKNQSRIRLRAVKQSQGAPTVRKEAQEWVSTNSKRDPRHSKETLKKYIYNSIMIRYESLLSFN